MKQIKYTIAILAAVCSLLLPENTTLQDEPPTGKAPTGRVPNEISTNEPVSGVEAKYSMVAEPNDPFTGFYTHRHLFHDFIGHIDLLEWEGAGLSDGLGSIVNMMTGQPAFNRSIIGYSGSAFGGAYDLQIGAMAELVVESADAGLFIFGSTGERSPYDRNGDGFSEVGKLSSETIGVNGFFRPFAGGDLQVALHRRGEDGRNGSNLDLPVHESSLSSWRNHTQWGGKVKWMHKPLTSFSYSITYQFSLHEDDSYFGGLTENTPEARLQALNYYGYTENPLHTGELLVNWLVGDHTISTGVRYDFDQLTDRSVASALFHIDEKFSNLGFFIQDNMRLGGGDRVNVIAGARFDRHSSLGKWIISPKIDLVYRLSGSINIALGYSTEFRVPRFYGEELTLCGLIGTQKVLRNSPDLREESNATFSAAFEFMNIVGQVPVKFWAKAFHTAQAGGYIDRYVGNSNNIELWQRENSEDATSWGVEIEVGIKPITGLEVRSSLSMISNPEKTEVENFNIHDCTPNEYGNLNITYEISDGFKISTAAKYTGKIQVPHSTLALSGNGPNLELVNTVEFIEFDVEFAKDFQFPGKISTTLILGVKNIADTFQNNLDFGCTRDPGYFFGPVRPRTFFMNLTLSL